MNERLDALEEELTALRPHEPSLELKQRIGSHLAPPLPVRPARRLVLVVVSGVIAAGLSLAILLGRVSHPWHESPSWTPFPQTTKASEVGHELPTLSTYQQALYESPEALDALLAKHAALTPMVSPHLAQIDVLFRSDADLRSLTEDF